MAEISLPTRKWLAATALALVAGAAWLLYAPRSIEPQADGAAAKGDPGRIPASELKRLGISLATAKQASDLPLGTVPATLTLPPDARVAVTSPFAGTAVRVMVVPGQAVARGQVLALVHAPEAVRFGAELARAEADLRYARAQAARLDTLAREGIVAGARADEARAALARSEASSRENRRLLALGGVGGDGSVALRSPIAGRVASVTIDTGAAVGAGGPAPFIVENVSDLALDLQLPERLAVSVRPGMRVEIRTAADAPPVAGRIVSVAPSLDPQTRSTMARATLADAGWLASGKSVNAVIFDAGGRVGVGVPSSALAHANSKDRVFVYSGGRFVARDVTVVAEAGGQTFIAAGLKPGETVASSGVAELKSLLADH